MSKNWIQPIKQNEYKIFVRFERGQEAAKKKNNHQACLLKTIKTRIIISCAEILIINNRIKQLFYNGISELFGLNGGYHIDIFIPNF